MFIIGTIILSSIAAGATCIFVKATIGLCCKSRSNTKTEEYNKNIDEICKNTKVKLVNQESPLLEDDICSICIEPIEVGDIITITLCEHQYHNTCIRQWLKYSMICPLCRRDLEKNKLITN